MGLESCKMMFTLLSQKFNSSMYFTVSREILDIFLFSFIKVKHTKAHGTIKVN